MYNQRSSYSSPTVLGIDEKFERPLTYLFGWVTGLIFLIIEKRNAAVRRHAYQSLVVFGTLNIIWVGILLLGILGAIPVLGFFIGAVLAIIGFIVAGISVLAWLILMGLAFISPETFFGAKRELM